MPEPSAKIKNSPRMGLGIDAGGTYTDVVLYDFAAHAVLQKAKRPTTKWDYALGIDAALDALDDRAFADVDLICVSTTLATNAVVEGRGQRVGLLVMPPYGRHDPGAFVHTPTACLDGRLDIDGRELTPIDPAQVQAAARKLMESEGVRAFAVAGFAGHVNPIHERQVRDALRAVTAATVVCGHDLSARLNYRVRAETAVLNARIIPCLDAFLEDVAGSMRRRGLRAPVMVVCSDGTLMSLAAARQRPVQTLFSGPAASMAGAGYLTHVSDALIVDIGGTTTDTAIMRRGQVPISPRGARVGRWQTHVDALDMRTLGLGGDSRIVRRDGEWVIGPRRIVPAAMLASAHPALGAALDWAEQHPHRFTHDTGGLEMLALAPYPHRDPQAGLEQAIVEALTRRPYTVDELIQTVGGRTEALMPLEALEADHIIQRGGLTPTDLLHANGAMVLGDTAISRRVCAFHGRLVGISMEACITQGLDRFARLLAVEVLKTRLAGTLDPEALAGSAPAMALLDKAFGDDAADDCELRLNLRTPLIGIGAPAQLLLPAAARLLRTEAIIPPHAEVANAVGAITAQVQIRRSVVIAIDSEGIYRVEGVSGAPVFPALDAAQGYAERELERQVRDLARQAGGVEGRVAFHVHTRQVATRYERQDAFLDCTIEAVLNVQPDLARLAVCPES